MLALIPLNLILIWQEWERLESFERLQKQQEQRYEMMWDSCALWRCLWLYRGLDSLRPGLSSGGWDISVEKLMSHALVKLSELLDRESIMYLDVLGTLHTALFGQLEPWPVAPSLP